MIRRPSVGYPPSRYLLDWLVPALFALLVSAVIRFHSLAPTATMARAVANLLAIDAVALLGLLALGRGLAVPKDMAVLLGALAVSAAVSVLGSVDPDISLQRLELYIAVGLLAMVFYLACRDVGHVPLEGYLLAVSLVHLPFLFAAVLWIKDLEPPFWLDGPRVAYFANVRQFGEFGFFAAASATGLGVISRRMSWPSFVLAAAALFGIILTGSRGALLSWVLYALLLGCFVQPRFRIALLALAPLAIAGALVWYLDHTGLMESPNVFGRVTTLIQEQGVSQRGGRITIWIESLRQIAEHPFFGSGPEGYWLSGCCVREFLQAHNFILQFLMEFGATGCVIGCLLVVRGMRKLGGPSSLRSLVMATPGTRVLTFMLCAYLAYSLIDQTMYHLLPLLLFAPVAGMLAAALQQARAAANSPS